MNQKTYYVIKRKLRGSDMLLPIRYGKEFRTWDEGAFALMKIASEDTLSDYVLVKVTEEESSLSEVEGEKR